MDVVVGERVDVVMYRRNCAGCSYRAATVCTKYGAFLQHVHRPTDCPEWKKLENKDEGI